MFIEELWEKNPKMVENEIKRIFCVNEEDGDIFNFHGWVEGRLHFVYHARTVTGISVGDFDIKTNWSDDDYEKSAISGEWRNIMKNYIGDKYIYHFIAKRNKQLDNFTEKYNNDTEYMVNKMGYQKFKGQSK